VNLYSGAKVESESDIPESSPFGEYVQWVLYLFKAIFNDNDFLQMKQSPKLQEIINNFDKFNTKNVLEPEMQDIIDSTGMEPEMQDITNLNDLSFIRTNSPPIYHSQQQLGVINYNGKRNDIRYSTNQQDTQHLQSLQQHNGNNISTPLIHDSEEVNSLEIQEIIDDQELDPTTHNSDVYKSLTTKGKVVKVDLYLLQNHLSSEDQNVFHREPNQNPEEVKESCIKFIKQFNDNFYLSNEKPYLSKKIMELNQTIIDLERKVLKKEKDFQEQQKVFQSIVDKSRGLIHHFPPEIYSSKDEEESETETPLSYIEKFNKLFLTQITDKEKGSNEENRKPNEENHESNEKNRELNIQIKTNIFRKT